jgi:hypothetical protein
MRHDPVAVRAERRGEVVVGIARRVASRPVANFQIDDVAIGSVDKAVGRPSRRKSRAHAGAQEDLVIVAQQRRLSLQDKGDSSAGCGDASARAARRGKRRELTPKLVRPKVASDRFSRPQTRAPQRVEVARATARGAYHRRLDCGRQGPNWLFHGAAFLQVLDEPI